jgi:hypothetical protein
MTGVVTTCAVRGRSCSPRVEYILMCPSGDALDTKAVDKSDGTVDGKDVRGNDI